MREREVAAWYQVPPDLTTLLRKRVQDEFLATSIGEYKVTKSSSHKSSFIEPFLSSDINPDVRKLFENFMDICRNLSTPTIEKPIIERYFCGFYNKFW